MHMTFMYAICFPRFSKRLQNYHGESRAKDTLTEDNCFFFLSVQELNICDSSPCLNGGTCFNTGASFGCICTRGYYGNRCELGKEDIHSTTTQPVDSNKAVKHSDSTQEDLFHPQLKAKVTKFKKIFQLSKHTSIFCLFVCLFFYLPRFPSVLA